MRCGSKSVGWIGGVVWLAACSADVGGPNRAPVADAGPDQVVVLGDGGTVAVLDGSGSYDPDGDDINLGWTLLSRPPGSAAALSAVKGEQVELQIDRAGDYLVGLVVSDGRLASERDVMRVRTAGEPCVDDGDCDDGVACTLDRCVNGTCRHQPSDAACDDGLWCNGAEVCDPAAGCQPGQAVDCDDGVACTADSCDEAADACAHAPADATCDDGLWCNGSEVCDPETGCQAGAAPDCDDEVGCTIDACDEEADACTHQTDAAACDDGFWCNGAEGCDAVQGCQPGTAPDCNDGVGCTQDSCDEQADACVNAPDNAACDDGLWCNGPEVCDPEAGCQRQAAPDCDDGIACTIDTCDEERDMCLQTPDDAACSDGNDCTVDTCLPDSGCQHVAGNQGQVCDQGGCTGTCSDGLCVPCACADDGDCDDGFACTTDICDAGVCVYQTDDAACDDGQWCNGAERCVVDQGCQPGTAPDCDDGVGCTDDSCDEDADHCSNVVDHANCDDGDWCNGAEVCDAVQDCQPGTPPDCDDGVNCTDDSCDEDGDVCLHTANDANCDDGFFCNGAETCDAQNGCQAGGDPCDDGVGCTVDTCDEDADSCSHAPDDAACNDGAFCNGDEICDAQNDCQPGTDPCDDGVGCTVDACDEDADSCNHTPDDALCDNGDFCDGAETCDAVLDCQAGADPCDDGVGCTVDTCDEDGDSCSHATDDAACDDGVFCNGAETCDPTLDCQPGADPCDDGVACTQDGCDEGGQTCSHTNDDAVCEEWASGALCAPACSPNDNGCVDPPTGLVLDCASPVLLPEVDSTCDLTLSGPTVDGQTACLGCSAEVGPTVFAATDFADDADPANCAALVDGKVDGWVLRSDTVCYNHGDHCPMDGADQRNCCNNFICPIDAGALNGQIAMQADRDSCIGGDRQWLLERTFDTTGHADLRLCYEWADDGADGNDGFQVEVANPLGTIAACERGGPIGDVDAVWHRSCWPLPAQAEDEPFLTVRFFLHSNDNNDRLYLDNISLTGWPDACPDNSLTVLDDDFAGCDTSNWILSNANLYCPGFDCNSHNEWSPGVEVDAQAGHMTTTFDASQLDSEVAVCFQLGHDGTLNTDRLELQIDSGSGFQTVWSQEGQLGQDGECRLECVDLSAADPAVHGNPAVGLRFDFDANDGKIEIYRVVVAGAVHCSAAAANLSLSPVTEVGGGLYQLTASNGDGGPLDGRLTCSWEPDPTVIDKDVIAYRNWAVRRKLTLLNAGRDALVDFPLPVLLDPGRIEYALTQDQGQDLRFFDADGSLLDHEIERWDESGTSVVWVRVPEVAVDSDSDYIWMAYGNPNAADAQNPDGVWDDNFVGVWHLAETSGTTAHDSSGKGNHGSYVNGPTLDQTGGFGDTAVLFDPAQDHHVDLGGLDVVGAAGDDGLTLEAYARLANDTGADRRLISKADGWGVGDHYWMLSLEDGTELRFRLRTGGSTDTQVAWGTDVSDNEWFYGVARYEGAHMRIYFDGVREADSGKSGTMDTDPAVDAWIGANPDNAYAPWDGPISEIRISNIGRSEDWIAAQSQALHDDVADPFVLYGPAEPL